MKAKDIIRTAQSRAGLYRQTPKMCRMACIEQRTFARRLEDPGGMTVSELRRLDRVVKFNAEEIVEIVRG